jgi:hypothetical protein
LIWQAQLSLYRIHADRESKPLPKLGDLIARMGPFKKKKWSEL